MYPDTHEYTHKYTHMDIQVRVPKESFCQANLNLSHIFRSQWVVPKIARINN